MLYEFFRPERTSQRRIYAECLKEPFRYKNARNGHWLTTPDEFEIIRSSKGEVAADRLDRSLVSLEARSVWGANLACLGCLPRGVSYMRLFSSDGILRRSALAGERRCVSHDSRSGGGRGEFLSQLLSWDVGGDKLSQSS